MTPRYRKEPLRNQPGIVENDLPSLLPTGQVHVQLEIIHPYLNGKGRLGKAPRVL